MPRSRARGAGEGEGGGAASIATMISIVIAHLQPRQAYSGHMSWKDAARRDPAGYYTLPTAAGVVRIFMTPALFAEVEESLGVQIENARRFPGVLDVAITPDAHHGYGVPVGCVMATSGTLAMGPVGYDIGCGIATLRSAVPRSADRESVV